MYVVFNIIKKKNTYCLLAKAPLSCSLLRQPATWGLERKKTKIRKENKNVTRSKEKSERRGGHRRTQTETKQKKTKVNDRNRNALWHVLLKCFAVSCLWCIKASSVTNLEPQAYLRTNKKGNYQHYNFPKQNRLIAQNQLDGQ